MSDEKKLTLEERFEALERIIGQMEEAEVSLDESFALYKSGIEQVKECNAMLEGIEAEMLKLNENGELEEF